MIDCKCNGSVIIKDCECVIVINKRLSVQLNSGRHRICGVCSGEVLTTGELMRHERDAALFLLQSHKALEQEYSESYLQNLHSICKFARKAIGLRKEELCELTDIPVGVIDLVESGESIISNKYLFALEALLYRVQLYGDKAITDIWKPISNIKCKFAN